METESTAEKKEAPPRPPPPKLFPDGDTPYKSDAPLSGMPYNFCIAILHIVMEASSLNLVFILSS